MSIASSMSNKGGYENIFVITEHFTRYAQAFSTKQNSVDQNTAILHYCFPDHLHQGTVKGKRKKRQTEEEVGRQYQRVDRNGLCQLN